MKHIQVVVDRKTCKPVSHACGECQTSCQSACKTSCTVANQKCEHEA
ncbi:six-cysteine peptide SCIFF [Oscillospiraceae bacterium HV4-5-C5C]|nr:six-cysteine ranthipeptide SCIFF [Oscillospiraceae bacterium]MDD4367962.1 six-cysteine ranthipeptide SCIFF [Oscillospiraceae bacterium]NJP41510.1 six-cysteine peptide SCIFF [Oscillospiraceae bacterium HV4-5-C5C]